MKIVIILSIQVYFIINFFINLFYFLDFSYNGEAKDIVKDAKTSEKPEND